MDPFDELGLELKMLVLDLSNSYMGVQAKLKQLAFEQDEADIKRAVARAVRKDQALASVILTALLFSENEKLMGICVDLLSDGEQLMRLLTELDVVFPHKEDVIDICA